MRAIETNYDGRRFRSRAEARWAVFLNALGLAYEYEPEGVLLGGTPYLPDFRVSEINCWIEVKGQEPVDEEARKCELLARESGMRCMLAIGAPKPQPHILVFPPKEAPFREDARYYFAEDRRTKGEFWLLSEDAGAFSVGPVFGESHDRYPVIHWAVERAYQLAQSARFEFGESG